MESNNKIGFCINTLDFYPKTFTILDEAGDYIRSLKEDKALIVNRAQTEEENMRIQYGILYFLLLERSQTQFDFKDLVLISRDGLKQCANYVHSIISDNWMRINTDVKSNVLSLLIDFLPYPMSESLFSSIFKRMTSGDLNQANLWLIENMLNLIEEHKEMVLKDRKLLPLIVYTYLRLVPTHYQMSITVNTPNNNLARLCRKEIAFALDFIRNNFDEVFRHGGRDMLFMLQQVSNIPEFKTLWGEMCHNIGSLSSLFTSVSEIFSIGTNKSIISTAIPFDMEAWILYTMRFVHHCSLSPYKRYQDLFSKRFFSTPESQNLRPFLIRYIIRCFYPDNEMIASTLMARWAIISWLLVQATSQTVVANCKLALIYDWMFYDNKNDCIMDIEPAMLAIMHNISKYSTVSVTLVDFLNKVANLYHPTLRDKIIASVRFGLSEAIRVSVFRSLGPLFDVLRHHGDLAKQFSELIGDNSVLPLAPVATVAVAAVQPVQQKPLDAGERAAERVIVTTMSRDTGVNIAQAIPTSDPKEKNGVPKQQVMPPASKPLEPVVKQQTVAPKVVTSMVTNVFEPPKVVVDITEPEETQKEVLSYDDLKRRFMKYSLAYDYNVERVNVPQVIAMIHSSIVPALEGLYETAEQCRHSLLTPSRHRRSKRARRTSSSAKQDGGGGAGSDEEHLQDMYERMEQVVIAILDDDAFDDLGVAGKTASVLCEICYPYFDRRLFPDHPDEEKLKVSLSSPVFVIFKNMCSMSTQDNKRELLLLLLSEMQMRQPRVGYYLLYYLKIAKVADPDLSIYRSLCNSLEKPNLKNSLYKDLELLSNDDSRLMVFLLPDLYSAFSTEMVGSPKFAHLILSTLDAAEINLIGLEIQKKNLVMFDPNSVVDILRSSLDWGTIEQYFLWELLLAHGTAPKHFYGLIPSLDYKRHPEAALRFSNFLRQDKPCNELMRYLLNRDVEKGDHFTATLLHFWSSDKGSFSAKFISILHTILSASLGNSGSARDKKKSRHSQNTEDSSVDLVKILGHLDFMRLNCKDISFLQDELIQSDLQQVLTSRSMSDDVKAHFSELLAIVDDGEGDDYSEDDDGGVGNNDSSGKNVTSSGRVLRNRDSRQYGAKKRKAVEEVPLSKANKRTRSISSSSSSEDDRDQDDDDDSDDQDGGGRKYQRGCSKKRLFIAD